MEIYRCETLLWKEASEGPRTENWIELDDRGSILLRNEHPYTIPTRIPVKGGSPREDLWRASVDAGVLWAQPDDAPFSKGVLLCLRTGVVPGADFVEYPGVKLGTGYPRVIASTVDETGTQGGCGFPELLALFEPGNCMILTLGSDSNPDVWKSWFLGLGPEGVLHIWHIFSGQPGGFTPGLHPRCSWPPALDEAGWVTPPPEWALHPKLYGC